LAADQGELFARIAPNGGHLGQSPAQTRARGLAARSWEHTLRDEDDFARHLDYIHFNPVKHGHVERVGAWPFSFHRMVRLGLYPATWADGATDQQSGFGERQWVSLHSTHPTSYELYAIKGLLMLRRAPVKPERVSKHAPCRCDRILPGLCASSAYACFDQRRSGATHTKNRNPCASLPPSQNSLDRKLGDAT
jgi:hypothetical protein